MEDLAAQLAEFELRCAGEDYKTAAAVALEIDYDYLHLWGHYRLVTELYERLQGHIADPALRQYSVGNLGAAYRIMAQYQRTIPLFEQALTLARERKDHEGEGACLGDLGNCYAELGETNQAIGYYEQALVISREVGNRHNEAVQLANLGNRYLGIGQIVLCIEYYKQALVIDRELGSGSTKLIYCVIWESPTYISARPPRRCNASTTRSPSRGRSAIGSSRRLPRPT